MEKSEMMSPKAVVEQFYGAYLSGDLETLMQLLAPTLEWSFEGDPEQILFAGTYHGPNGFMRFVGRTGSTIETRSIEMLDLHESGNDVQVRAKEVMHSLNTGREGTFEIEQHFTIEDGRIVKFHETTDLESLAELLGDGDVSGLPEQCISNDSVRMFDQIPGLQHRTLSGNGPHPGGAQGLEVWHQVIQPGSATPPHRHDCDEVVVLLKGSMLCIVAGVKQDVGPQSTIMVPRNTWHVLEPKGEEPAELIGILNMSPVEVYLPGNEPLVLPWDAIPAAESAA